MESKVCFTLFKFMSFVLIWASIETHLLQKSIGLIEKALEDPRRVLWLADKCSHERSKRATGSSDLASDLLGEERRVAADCKRKLESSLLQTKTLLAQLKSSRDELLAIIKRESLSLSLTTESTFCAHAMLDPGQFPIADSLHKVQSIARAQRDSNIALIAHCKNVLSHIKQSTESAVGSAIKAERSHQVGNV